jgi:aspartate kinase
MEITVKKFGGTSVGSIEKIMRIAKNLAEAKQSGENIVTVVSAMGKTTDNLTRLAYKVSAHPGKREMDMLLTAGERISMSLLALALHNYGVESISFTGSQSGIITDCNHGNARILDVKAFRIREELAKGKLVIVAGFQGVSSMKEVTTLGRGGSDTSAVALAAYLEAVKCEIYTDVEGIYTYDPNVIKRADIIPYIDYDSCIALAMAGAKVIHPRAVEFASAYGIDVEVKSSFSFNPGTIIGKETVMEERKVTALTAKEDIRSLELVNDEKAEKLFQKIGFTLFSYKIDNNILTLFYEDKNQEDLDDILSELNCHPVNMRRGLTCITLIGSGAVGNMSLVAEVLAFFQKRNITIENLINSLNGISIFIKTEELKLLVDELHKRFIEGII